jgi:hypothetical protein
MWAIRPQIQPPNPCPFPGGKANLRVSTDVRMVVTEAIADRPEALTFVPALATGGESRTAFTSAALSHARRAVCRIPTLFQQIPRARGRKAPRI